MLYPKYIPLIALFSWLFATNANSQDTMLSSNEYPVTDKAIALLEEKAKAADKKMEKSMIVYLLKLQRQEKKLKGRNEY